MAEEPPYEWAEVFTRSTQSAPRFVLANAIPGSDPVIGPCGEPVRERGAVAEAGDVDRALVRAADEAGRPEDVVEEHVGRPVLERREVASRGVGRHGVSPIVETPGVYPGSGQVEP